MSIEGLEGPDGFPNPENVLYRALLRAGLYGGAGLQPGFLRRWKEGSCRVRNSNDLYLAENALVGSRVSLPSESPLILILRLKLKLSNCPPALRPVAIGSSRNRAAPITARGSFDCGARAAGLCFGSGRSAVHLPRNRAGCSHLRLVSLHSFGFISIAGSWSDSRHSVSLHPSVCSRRIVLPNSSGGIPLAQAMPNG